MHSSLHGEVAEGKPTASLADHFQDRRHGSSARHRSNPRQRGRPRWKRLGTKRILSVTLHLPH